MILGVIPARYNSTRFPGKPLTDIQGKSMVQRVYEQAKKCEHLSKVVVATDDKRIFDHVKSFGGEVVMTEPEHPSGTDRCYEALKKILAQERSLASGGKGNYKYVINIQGDEPFIDPSQIDILAQLLLDGKTELATLMIPVDSYEVLFDRGEVKIVMNDKMEALYFSREVIPYLKGEDSDVSGKNADKKRLHKKEWHKHFQYYRHVGMYAYRNDILEKITKLEPSPLEKAESLEQLRWLENGFKIKLAVTNFESHCIDRPEDVEKVLKLFKINPLS